MPYFIYQLALFVHIFSGSIALFAFWIPMIAKKGNAKHKSYGKVFANCMYLVSISGFIMTLIVLSDPLTIRFPDGDYQSENITQVIDRSRTLASFLLMVSMLVFCNVRQAILVLKAKSSRQLLKTPSHVSLVSFLGIMAIIIGWIGFSKENPLLQVFSLLSFFNSIGMLYYIFKPSIKSREWIIAHLGNILGAGIGCYTAFFVFGSSQLFKPVLTDSLTIIPWVAPGIIGAIGLLYLTQKYQRKYRIQ